MDSKRVCTTALTWQPERKRNVVQPETTCRRTVETEKDKLEMNSWARAETVAKNRDK